MLTLGRPKDDYSVLSPLTGLRGRNGGLGLKSRWRALWAIGVKVVSLKSTFWGFWWIWVVGWSGRVVGSLGGSMSRVGFALYMRRTLVGGVGLYTAGGGHLWGLKGFGWGDAGAVSLGDSSYFQLSSFILI